MEQATGSSFVRLVHEIDLQTCFIRKVRRPSRRLEYLSGILKGQFANPGHELAITALAGCRKTPAACAHDVIRDAASHRVRGGKQRCAVRTLLAELRDAVQTDLGDQRAIAVELRFEAALGMDPTCRKRQRSFRPVRAPQSVVAGIAVNLHRPLKPSSSFSPCLLIVLQPVVQERGTPNGIRRVGLGGSGRLPILGRSPIQEPVDRISNVSVVVVAHGAGCRKRYLWVHCRMRQHATHRDQTVLGFPITAQAAEGQQVF